MSIICLVKNEGIYIDHFKKVSRGSNERKESNNGKGYCEIYIPECLKFLCSPRALKKLLH